MIKISGLFHKKHTRRADKEGMYICLPCRSEVQAKEQPSGRRRGRPPGSFCKKVRVQKQTHKKVIPARKSTRLKKTKTSLGERISVRLKNHKKVVASKPLRRSGRRPKHVTRLQDKSNVPGGSKKRKLETKRGRGRPKKVKQEISIRKKRTKRALSYWLNGLLLSRKPGDERVDKFREERYFKPVENSDPDHDQPKCRLCGLSDSGSTFISCEMCKGNPNHLLVHHDLNSRTWFPFVSQHLFLNIYLSFAVMFVEWYHGDACGINEKNSSMVIGFRCNLCRDQLPPTCPHEISTTSDVPS